ncbi:hypothetical protein [Aquibacillus salsiterrae]|uniref:Uncharacterized protein n=1 Tax=Aquibacillus salsiterrae TaxID=2950439 RepID=A0A9X3WHR0_9BACI|nr:hypothetical protein [Aquibacillus salsiterrae]MDC3417619.1 hypothetical protein [Aquibacillus salsiterrae]
MKQEYAIYGIILMLVISVIVNVISLSKINQVESQIQFISSNQQNIQYEVSNQANEVNNFLNDMKREQSWISPFDVDLPATDNDPQAILQWQIKELQSGAKVTLYYLMGAGESYTAVPAEQINQGLFEAKVPLNLDLRPQWEIGFMSGNSSIQETRKKVAEEQYQQNVLKYYVSMSNGEIEKNSDIKTTYLGDYGVDSYGIIQSDIELREKSITVNLYHHNQNISDNVIEQVYLSVYEGDSLVAEEQLNAMEGDAQTDKKSSYFRLEKEKNYENKRLVIKVIYSNGKTFTKSVN